MRIPYSLLLVVLAGASVSAHAQSTLPLSGCEAPPEVRSAIDGALSQDSLAKLKIKERISNSIQETPSNGCRS